MKTRNLRKLFNAEKEIEGRISVYKNFEEFLKSRLIEKKKITKAQVKAVTFMKRWIFEYVGHHSSVGRVFSDEVIKFTFQMICSSGDITHALYLN